MDFGDEPPAAEATKKAINKKSVVIDDTNKDIKFINIEDNKTSGRDGFYRNVNLYEWPWRVVTILFLIGYLFLVISYATPYWMVTVDNRGNDVTSVGLWSACSTISNCSLTNGKLECQNVVRAFGGISLLCGMAVIVLLGFQLKQPESRSCLNRAIIACTFTSALCIQIFSSIFWRTDACYYCESTPATSVKWAWSLALAFTSLLLMVVTGLSFLAVEMIMLSRKVGAAGAWKGRGFQIT